MYKSYLSVCICEAFLESPIIINGHEVTAQLVGGGGGDSREEYSSWSDRTLEQASSKSDIELSLCED